MLGIALLAIGIAGFGLAAYWDLRYTEFPDWLPYSIIILAIAARGLFSFLLADWWILLDSILVGTTFLAIGLLMYFTRQWGDGDAWLLGALGFLIPDGSGFAVRTFLPFPLAVLFNFLLAALVYLIVYSVILGIKNRGVNRKYAVYLRKEKYRFSAVTAFFFGLSWASAYAMHALSFSQSSVVQMLALPFLLTFILFFSYYAKIVEKNLFKRRIRTSELKEGDVVLEGKWKGLTSREIATLRKKNRYAWIKEGVRFAPVFLLTMLITVIFGDLIIILI